MDWDSVHKLFRCDYPLRRAPDAFHCRLHRPHRFGPVEPLVSLLSGVGVSNIELGGAVLTGAGDFGARRRGRGFGEGIRAGILVQRLGEM